MSDKKIKRTRRNGQFDISRKRVDNKNTLYFIGDIEKLDELGIGMTMTNMSKLLRVGKNALRRWEREKLIFPVRSKARRVSFKKYRYKDIMRGFTIKYLRSEMGIETYEGIRLVLELTNQVITSKDEPVGTINNYRIDKFLMKVLNYDVELTALGKKAGYSDEVINQEEQEYQQEEATEESQIDIDIEDEEDSIEDDGLEDEDDIEIEDNLEEDNTDEHFE